MIRDIAERREREAAHRESERKFRILVEGAKDYALFMMDPDGRVASWDAGAERILGFKEDEILGRMIDAIFTPEDRARGEPGNEIATALREGRAENERWHLRRDGSRFLATGVLTPMKDEEGRLQGFAKLMQDITERRKTEEALMQAQKMESIGILAGGVAHDFNNLLTGILGNASLAIDELPRFSRARPMLEEVIETT